MRTFAFSDTQSLGFHPTGYCCLRPRDRAPALISFLAEFAGRFYDMRMSVHPIKSDDANRLAGFHVSDGSIAFYGTALGLPHIPKLVVEYHASSKSREGAKASKGQCARSATL